MKSVYSFIAPANFDINIDTDLLKIHLLHHFRKSTIIYEFNLNFDQFYTNFKLNMWTNENTLYVHPSPSLSMDDFLKFKQILLTYNFFEGFSL